MPGAHAQQAQDKHEGCIEEQEESKEQLVVKSESTNQTPYYRKINEPVTDSLYRDHLNRQQRAQMAKVCQEINRQKQSGYVAPRKPMQKFTK